MRIAGIVLCILVVGFFAGYKISGADLNFLVDDKKTATQSAVLPQSSSADKNSDMQNRKTQVQNNNGSISVEEAKQIAVEDAGIDENNIYKMRAKQENYYGVDIYDVDFESGSKEYSYNIDIATGDIIAKDYEISDRYWKNIQGKQISEQEAMDLVLNEIGGGSPQDVQMRTEHDDGRLMYEGRAMYNGVRYEFEIDSISAMIVDWKMDKKGDYHH